ncbi:glycine-rich domain-containing protein [Corynebacterium accolens]
MSILISGGGASGAFHPRSTGGGGGGGQLRLLTVDLVENPGSRASVTVGRGGSALHSVSPYGNNGDSTRFNGWNAESTWTADGGTTRVGANEEDGFGDGWNSLPEREARYLDRAPGSRYRPQTGGSKGQTFGGDGSMGGGGGKNLHFSTGRSGAGGDGFAIIHFFGIDPMTPRLEGGSVTPPEPPAQNGSYRGEWAAGVRYMEGDTFLFRGQRFRVKSSHTSSGGGGSPAMIDTPGIAQSYYERI